MMYDVGFRSRTKLTRRTFYSVILVGALLVLPRALADTDGGTAPVDIITAIRELTQEVVKARVAFEEIAANENTLKATMSQAADTLGSIKATTDKMAGVQERMASDQAKGSSTIVLSAVSHREKTDQDLCSKILKNNMWKTVGALDFTPATDQYLDPSTGTVTQKKAGFVSQLICSN